MFTPQITASQAKTIQRRDGRRPHRAKARTHQKQKEKEAQIQEFIFLRRQPCLVDQR